MQRTIVVSSALTLALCASSLCARTPSFDVPEWDEAVEPDRAPRKGSSLFISPSKDNPADQLAYAIALEEKQRLSSATSAYRALVHYWHDAPEAVRAQQAYARLLEARGYLEDAFDEYQYLIDHFAGPFDYSAVIGLQMAIAKTVWERRSTHLFDFSGYSSEVALNMFHSIVRNAPHTETAIEAQLQTAAIYRYRGEFENAVESYEGVRERHLASPLVIEASFRRATSLFEIAQSRRRDEDSQKLAFRALVQFQSDFPQSAYDQEAEKFAVILHRRLENMAYDRASFYDRRRHNPQAAVIAYQRFLKEFPTSERHEKVLDRIQSLSEPQAKDSPS